MTRPTTRSSGLRNTRATEDAAMSMARLTVAHAAVPQYSLDDSWVAGCARPASLFAVGASN